MVWYALKQTSICKPGSDGQVSPTYGSFQPIHQIHVNSKILEALKFSPFHILIENWKFPIFQLHCPRSSDFMAILGIFSPRFEDKIWFGAFSGYPWNIKKLNKIIDFERMWTLPGTLWENLLFKFVFNPKVDLSGDQKHKTIDFDTNSHILRSTWEFNKIMLTRLPNFFREDCSDFWKITEEGRGLKIFL